jgi:hypothetical protein
MKLNAQEAYLLRKQFAPRDRICIEYITATYRKWT